MDEEEQDSLTLRSSWGPLQLEHGCPTRDVRNAEDRQYWRLPGTPTFIATCFNAAYSSVRYPAPAYRLDGYSLDDRGTQLCKLLINTPYSPT